MSSESRGPGLLLVLSAPSGAGKTTLARLYIAASADAAFSISATTRTPRGAERDGVDYHFVSPRRFAELVEMGAFAEWAEVQEVIETGNGQLDAAREEIRAWWRPGRLPYMLGGDHTATVPVIEAIAPAFPELRVIQLDAHPDLREEFLGERYNYASAMARVMDTVPPERVYQVGIRTGAREEYARRRPRFYPAFSVHPVEAVRALLPELRRHPIYVTIDVDVLDPAEAPGTGSPEPGGLRVPELIEIVRMLGECDVIGGDLVEVAHAWDPSGRTGIAAAWVIRESLLTWWGHCR